MRLCRTSFMNIILVPILYYTFFGFLIVFSLINNLQITKKLIKQSYLFYLYASVEFIIASLLTIYSVIQSNYILLIIGSLLFLSSVYSFWKREELLFQTEQLGNQYEYIGAFMCFFLAALIYFFDSASSVT